MRSLTRLFPFAAAAALSLYGCTARDVVPTPKGERSQFSARQVNTAEQDSKDKRTNNGVSGPGSADLELALRALSGVSVFFAFDQSTLTPDAEAKLTRVAEVLVQHPNLSIEIQGNTDERGTEAYNQALGQKRADAARDCLVRRGVKTSQISAVSFGDDKPKAAAKDEAAFQKNRRDDVIAK